jgi:hypothetical protein
MGIIKIYHDKKWTLQFLDALYNSIDVGFVFGFVGLENRYQIVVNYRMNKNDFLFLIYLQYSSMSIYKLVNYFVVA